MKDHHTHFRRCHLCNCLSEVENDSVRKCNQCGKAFAPFVFFDETKISFLKNYEVEHQEKNEFEKKLKQSELVSEALSKPFSENQQDYDLKKASSYKITRLATQTKYPPLVGLTVYW